MSGINPVDDRLMIDREQACDATKAVAFKVEFKCQLASGIIITERAWGGRVLATARLALKALTSGAVKACFDLLLGSLAIGTNQHVKLYTIVWLDLDTPQGPFLLTR